MPRSFLLASIGLNFMRGAVILECLTLCVMALKLFGPNQRLLIRGAFLVGLLTVLASMLGFSYLRTAGLSASWPGMGFGPDPITQTLCLVAVETGIVGYFSFESLWRISPLALALGGTLLLGQSTFKLF